MDGIYKAEAAEIKVSIIIPVYNAEKYLPECLESVMNQTLREIEIICVDDGSTDGSLAQLQHYARKDGRIRIIEQANQGAGAARNAGIAAAKGEYLAFLDADDLYVPQTLEEAYRQAAGQNVDLLLLSAIYIGQAGRYLKQEPVDTVPLGGLRIFSAREISRFIFQIASCNTWNKLYKKSFIQKQGLHYQEIKTANDLCFVYSAIACAGRIAVLDMPLVKHRVLQKGNLQSVKTKTPMNFLEALLLLKENLRRAGLWELLQESYINCALYHCVYNYRTVGAYGRAQIISKSHEICELLEFQVHSENCYYNRNDYLFMRRVLYDPEGTGVSVMGKLKNMMKRILPPPVNAFNREINNLRQYMTELNAAAEIQQQRRQESSVEMLLEKMAGLEANQLAILEQMSKLEAENLELRKRVCEKIEDSLQSKYDKLETAIQNMNKPILRDYAFYEKLSPKQYESELKLRYKSKTGEELHLEAPWTYSEKIQWLKLYDCTPLKTRLADKYLVREWIKEKIGEEFLIPLLGVWDHFDEIDFDALPDRFVLKANHGSGWNIFVNDKTTLDKKDTKKKLDKWMGMNYAFYSLELHYMNITPKIIAEQYMDGLDRYDYKFMCFGGEVKFLWVNTNRFTDLRTSLMTTDWQPIEAMVNNPAPDFEIPKPKTFDKMLEIATTLSQGFSHVRVDLYEVAGQVYFGEMTFTSLSGISHIMPKEFNEQMGKWLKLPPKSPIPKRLQ